VTVRLITFDLDDTLWESRPVLLKAELAMLEWLAEHYPRLSQQFSPEQLRALKNQVAQAQPHLQHRVSQLRQESLRQALDLAGYGESEAAEGAAAAFRVFHQARQQVTLFDSVIPTLADLHTRYCLGALTNGNADANQIGLMTYFDFALCAEDLGASKPAPDLFQAALRRTGCDAREAVHVGDHPLDDMEGALACGFRTVWANFRQQPWTASWRPDAEIHHWRELLDVIARFDRPQPA